MTADPATTMTLLLAGDVMTGRGIDQVLPDLLHGHSSHHAMGIEVYDGKLVLYGCGDLLNDYEGIRGYEQFRDDLALIYMPTLCLPSGRLTRLTILPYRIRNFRLSRAPHADTLWLRDVLSREGGRFSTWLSQAPDGTLTLGWRE